MKTSVPFRPNVANQTVYTTQDRAVAGLQDKLRKLSYSPLIASEIAAYARREGSLGDLVAQGLVDQEDEEVLEAALAESFDRVPFTSGAWGVVSDRWASLDASDVEAAELDEIRMACRCC